MIIDLARFVKAETAYWNELEGVLNAIENNPVRRIPLNEIQRLHYLYERCSADLVRLDTFSTEPQLRDYLESLVARAYSEIHETRTATRIQWKNTVLAFPRAFRRHLRAFQLSLIVTLLGCAFGWFVVHQDSQVKAILMPFPGLLDSPADRVAKEESATKDRLKGVKGSFAAQLMTNNIRVTLLAMATGITWGAGTLILLFYNGVILGAVAADYIAGGQGVFLAGWLLPHKVHRNSGYPAGRPGWLHSGWRLDWVGREYSASATVSRSGAGFVRDSRRRSGHAGAWAGLMEAFHLAVPPAGASVCFENFRWAFAKCWFFDGIPWMGASRELAIGGCRNPTCWRLKRRRA